MKDKNKRKSERENGRDKILDYKIAKNSKKKYKT
jgi:hypothetical protein